MSPQGTPEEFVDEPSGRNMGRRGYVGVTFGVGAVVVADPKVDLVVWPVVVVVAFVVAVVVLAVTHTVTAVSEDGHSPATPGSGESKSSESVAALAMGIYMLISDWGEKRGTKIKIVTRIKVVLYNGRSAVRTSYLETSKTSAGMDQIMILINV